MPASPLFALIAPSTQATQTSPLSQGMPSKSGALSPLQGVISPTADLDQAENGLSFFQQLQMASELSPLPTGQEFAAYLPQELQPVESSIETVDPDFIGPLALEHAVNIANEGANSSDVLYTQPLQTPITQTAETDPPEGLQYLESLRRAQPHVQPAGKPQDGLAGTELTEDGDTKGQIEAGNNTALNKTISVGVDTQLQANAAKVVAPTEQAVSPTTAMNAQANKMLNLDELGMDAVTDEASLEGLDAETISIHEAPKTLTTAKELTATATLAQPIEGQSPQDIKAGVSDITPGMLKDSQTTKSMALEQSVTNQAQASEKSSAAFNKMDIPPQHPQWNDQVAKRISIMASESVQSARIQLDPPELGALEVKIKVQHDQVSVSFGSNNALVRDALESQTPRLRELLEQQGINLADVNVSEQGAQQGGQGQDETLAGEMGGDGNLTDSDFIDEDSMTAFESDSLVDYFA